MSELNLQQIINRLNSEFTGDTRKLVFWYDDNGDFAEDIQDVVLENAKIHILRPDNQFYTKYMLEIENPKTNYLIYAPFPKPDVWENHLEDTMLYSRRFYADRASLLCKDLGISEKYKPVIDRHIKFFANKERTRRFYDLEIERFNEETILTGLICAICKTRVCSFEEALRVVITDGNLEQNEYLEEMDKYGLSQAFWKLCEQQFGYTDADPTLEKFLLTLFVTYTDKYVKSSLPKAWNIFVSFKSGNIIAFLDSLMNSVLYREKYDELSDKIAAKLNVHDVFSKMLPEDLVSCDTFRDIDEIISHWLVGRLLAEDTGAALNGQTIPQICDSRMKQHFGKQNEDCYLMLKSAYQIICAGKYQAPEEFLDIVNTYCEKDFLLDREYRYFYYHYDRIDDTSDFEQLQVRVENIYTNDYLSELLPRWNYGLKEIDDFNDIYFQQSLQLQRNFYKITVGAAMNNERTVVIISDAMRYEVGKELFERISDDPKSKDIKIKPMLSVLPSYTRLGMAALLPYQELTMTDDYKVLANGILCDSLQGRQEVLQSSCNDSVCVQFDDIKTANKEKLRSIFTGKQVVYVYHNQIDARGDKQNTEDEVFVACEEAIEEIIDLMHRISVNANTYRFIVTADHGFIYKRDKLTESDKIDVSSKKAFVNRRFVVDKEPIREDGVLSMSMGEVLGNDDDKIVSFPIGSNVFKVAGGGANFVHGGSSPQEMLVPVIDIKMERGHMQTKPAQVILVSTMSKITNKIVSMSFMTEAVTDTVKETTYRLYFISEDGERISNENILVADSREQEDLKRITQLKFTFKDQKYDRNKQYFLVACDESNNVEALRHPMIIDIAFGDDYGFGL